MGGIAWMTASQRLAPAAFPVRGFRSCTPERSELKPNGGELLLAERDRQRCLLEVEFVARSG
jgi:hypothetical protein